MASLGTGVEAAEYPAPYDDYPRCCYQESDALFGNLPRSRYSRLTPASLDRDPYSQTNLGYVQDALDRYRAIVSEPAWSVRIAEYPAPEWLQKRARELLGCNYATVEKEAGSQIEREIGLVLEPLPLRALVLSLLRQGDDPKGVIAQILKGLARRAVTDPEAYLLGIARRNGEVIPEAPREPLEEPLTVIYRPSLASSLKGWTTGRPDYDVAFERETKIYHKQPYRLPWRGALEETEVGLPRTSPEDWLEQVRSGIDPKRARAKAAKVGGR